MRFGGLALTLVFGPVAALIACGARTDPWDLSRVIDAVDDASADATANTSTTATPTPTPTTTATPTTSVTVTATGSPPGSVYCAPVAPPGFPTVACPPFSACDLPPGAPNPTCAPHAGPWNCGRVHCKGRCSCLGVAVDACGCAP